MKKLMLLVVSVCIAEVCFSQTDFRNGYIVTHANDTVFGLVGYHEKAKAYKSCDFRTSKDAGTVTYEPDKIIGYGFVDDKAFLSKEISLKDKPSQVVFLEVIVSGFVSLYKFEGKYFVAKGDESLQQLINESSELVVDGVRVSRNSNEHIVVLSRLLFDCVETRNQVQQVKLDEKELGKLVQDYNRCMGQTSITFKSKKPWTKAIVGLTAGLNISKLKFINESWYYYYLTGESEVSSSPTIGVSLDLMSPRLSERFSFHIDFLYLSSKYKNYSFFDRSTYLERNYITTELQQLNIPLGIRYTFPERAFTPYVTAGISGVFHLSSKSKWICEQERPGGIETQGKEALDMKDRQAGVWGSVGVLKPVNKKFNALLEFRYDQTNGIVPFSVDSEAHTSKISNFQILLGIRTR